MLVTQLVVRLTENSWGLSRVAHSFHLLPQFSAIGSGFLEGCTENVLVIVSVGHGHWRGWGRRVSNAVGILCLNEIDQPVFVKRHVWKKLCHFFSTELEH